MQKTLAAVALTAVMWCMSSASRSLKEDCAKGDATCFCTANTAGYYADLATGCQYYYWCMSEGQGSYIPCGAGTLFRQDVHICDYTNQVACGGVPASPSVAAPTATSAPAAPAEEAAPASPPIEEQTSPAPAAVSNPSCDVNEPSWPGASGVAAYISPGVWCQMFVHTGDSACSPGFYTYSAFIDSTRAFPDFGNAAGDAATNKREIAAFLAQISHETTGGPLLNNQYDWGLCFHEEQSPPSNYCVPDPAWPCAANASYHGRGPIQLSYNYNYGQVGQALGIDLLNHPSLVSSNGTIAFETALWFWMTPQPPKPSAHDVVIGRYQPTQADIDAGRVDGFGLTTNIINGGLECGPDNAKKEQQWAKQVDRMNYFKRYAQLLGTDAGDNLDCAGQQPFSAVPVVASASLAAAPAPAPGVA